MAGESKSKLSGRDYVVLLMIGSVHLTGAICISVQGPFFPKEAALKNVTQSQFGMVFGMYELTAFVSAPVIGQHINQIGANTSMCAGVLVASIASIVFGFLDYVSGSTTFFALALVIRMVEALGSTAAVTTAFSITAAAFPDNLATAFASLEICFGVGYMSGPLLGGLLYSLGGFVLPFFVIGCIMFIDAIAIFFLMPTYTSSLAAKKGNLREMLKMPWVLIDCLCIAGVTMCDGFYSATMEPHLRQFGLSPLQVGLVFTCGGIVYAVVAPIVGRLCDSYFNPKYFLVFGCLMAIVSVCLAGPAPFIPLPVSLLLACLGLGLGGMALASICVAAFSDAIATAVDNGFPDDIVTYSLVSGLWTAAFSFGDFVGPSVGGILADWVGFPKGSMFILAVQAVVLICIISLMTRDRCARRLRRDSYLLLAEPGDLPESSNISRNGYGALEGKVPLLDPTVAPCPGLQ